MWTWMKELWYDKTTARVTFLGLVALGGSYYLQPRDRDVWERLVGAASITFVVGGAALSAPKNGDKR